MPELILEVGTEEMPAGALESALEQLNGVARKALCNARLEAESVSTFGTPRRIILRAVGVPTCQPDVRREVRGPSAAVAFKNGEPTGAAIGFARKQSVPLESLEVVATPQGEYVQARVLDVGKPASEVLGPILADAVRGLFFPKMMRWGEGAIRFVRPVRWILCLLGSDVVPMDIGGVKSGNLSRGHRFLAPDGFVVPDASAYFGLLDKAFVMWDPVLRRETIRKQADALAACLEGAIPWDEGLLDENNWLVEWPTALLGGFDPAYLELPRPILVTAMKKHQRFFPVEAADGSLLPNFISIRNGGNEHLEIVREGNERVLTSRFSDAHYFYQQDRNNSLDNMAAQLGRLVFQEKLGTMADKRNRLMALASVLASSLGMNGEEKLQAVRAADLCKADLVSRMVIELPALQGIMGREYALLAGESSSIADAVAEHYKPRSAGDALPVSKLGCLLAVADRMDTLVGYVGIGIMPSGSSDPYGLRRAAQGIVQILAGNCEACSLVEIQVQAAEAYRQVNGLDIELDPLCNNLRTLFDQRLESVLSERGVRYDLINASLSGGAIFSTLVYAVIKRAETLQSIADDPEFVPTVQAAARVANILRAAGSSSEIPLVPGKHGIHGDSARTVERAVSVLESERRKVDTALFADESERDLFDAASKVLPDVARKAAEYDYAGVYAALNSLRAPIDLLFDKVLVMAEDKAVCTNRLALLSFVDALYKTLADFTKVVVA